MKNYYVYMLLCADGKFYVGVTNDVDARVAQHQLGIDPHCYTFKRRPVRLVHASNFYDVNDAIAWEKQLKRWSRAKKEALIDSDWAKVHELAACTNETAAVPRLRSGLHAARDDMGSG